MVMCQNEEIQLEHLPIDFKINDKDTEIKNIPQEPLQTTECHTILEVLAKT